LKGEIKNKKRLQGQGQKVSTILRRRQNISEGTSPIISRGSGNTQVIPTLPRTLRNTRSAQQQYCNHSG